ncbi:MAG: 4Fe-4S dicluster domain-containing protein [Candidatus Bathyarchaeota archaeon]|jgi:heterodisulfide reductase subunit C|nr:4Fe-4S dicluster domain-containing protein [Candidatus Bathyarchaeota archaeon]
MAQEKTSPKNFSKEITSRLGGETITFCYQCGTCASSCPVAKITEKFNPREVIRLALLGMRDEVLSGDAIWLCSSCYNCQERCPQKVEIADVIYALRNIAIREGHVPNIYSEFAAGLMSEGRIVPISKFLEKKRPEYGLPPLKPAGVDAIRKILSATGFDKIQFKKGETS